MLYVSINTCHTIGRGTPLSLLACYVGSAPDVVSRLIVLSPTVGQMCGLGYIESLQTGLFVCPDIVPPTFGFPLQREPDPFPFISEPIRYLGHVHAAVGAQLSLRRVGGIGKHPVLRPRHPLLEF